MEFQGASFANSPQPLHVGNMNRSILTRWKKKYFSTQFRKVFHHICFVYTLFSVFHPYWCFREALSSMPSFNQMNFHQCSHTWVNAHSLYHTLACTTRRMYCLRMGKGDVQQNDQKNARHKKIDWIKKTIWRIFLCTRRTVLKAIASAKEMEYEMIIILTLLISI